MNYLTNYYKNLCEQLQERINVLEANIRSASEIEKIGEEEYEKAVAKKKSELGRDLTSQEFSDILDVTISPYTRRASKRESLIRRATEQLPSVAQTGDVETATQYADVMGDISKKNISGKVVGFANLEPEHAESIKRGIARVTELGQDMRKRGIQTSVPADIPSMRKFIQMGKGKYEAPYPQPEGPVGGMHTTPSHY
jgi:hypothetical protein